MQDRDSIILDMRRHVGDWESTGDRRAIFLGCYLRMTENMLGAIGDGEFHDAAWVSALLHHFADYYFNALAAYDRGDPNTPAVWQQTHDAARNPETMVLQNLLLGVNAHINYDLVLALVDMLSPEWGGLDAGGRTRRYEDHDHVNDVIARTVDCVQDEVVERYAPEMDLIDKLLGPVDEWLAASLIRRWRDEVWDHAVEMLEAPEKQRRIRSEKIERAALNRAARFLGVSP
jgi:hypothetical protein